ncbi:MAG: hypothetical protein LC650_02030 [Actinobacteria bacterium]|nr:hypothetical protein [Actinomycetota bacterium]
MRYLFDPEVLGEAIDQGINLRNESNASSFSISFIRFICEYVVTDWDSIKDPNGGIVEYDPDVTVAIFEKYPLMLQRVVDTSKRLSRFSDA